MEGEKGKVYLVGAGPGDPGLITLKGFRLLKMADVVIYDRLVHPEILSEIPLETEKFYVGKKCDHHTVPQDEINALMVDKAREGKIIVEEGIEWEVVPGVTSATAVPAYAGIPITHREFSSMVSIITGHETFSKDRTQLRYDLIAPNDSTLVILMGMTSLNTIVDELILHGRPASTPTCIITWGTYPEQQVISGTLGDILDKKEKAGLNPPGIVVIGEVVRLREELVGKKDP